MRIYFDVILRNNDIVPFLPYFLDLQSNFLRRNLDVLIKVPFRFMSADFHYELHRGTGKKFVRTKGSSPGVRAYSDIFWLCLNYVLVSFFMRNVIGSSNPASLATSLI